MAEDTRKGLTQVRTALDLLGVALANDGHTWSAEERAAHEQAIDHLATMLKGTDHG